MRVEPVHAIWEYYDGIRTGIADYLGQPHYFEQERSESKQDYLPTFLLKPITRATLVEALEQSAIFRSWETQFHLGEVAESTHPGLPGQNARYLELERRLKAVVGESPTSSTRPMGRFARGPGQDALPQGVIRGMQVTWHDVA